MSFKREGDDSSMLRNLQHRRVGDLLSNHIPDEEAKLLSNGRLTCLVCPRRPIFDTISMLSVHRKGKKHLIELSKNLAAKRELEQRKSKIDNEMMASTGSLPASETMLGTGMLLTGCKTQYLSCAKRTVKEKVPLRRTTLHVGSAGNPTSHLTQGTESAHSASSDVRKYLKEMKKKKDLKRSIEECRMNYRLQTTKELKTTNQPTTPTKTKECSQSDTHKKVDQGMSATVQEAVKKQAATDLKFKMSGWLKDSSGTWKKDPEAEFDSDEEEPGCQ